jgi:hypothetical protein
MLNSEGGEGEAGETSNDPSFEEQAPHFGPVPEISESVALAEAGTPDVLLELRNRYLENGNVTEVMRGAVWGVCMPFVLLPYTQGARMEAFDLSEKVHNRVRLDRHT